MIRKTIFFILLSNGICTAQSNLKYGFEFNTNGSLIYCHQRPGLLGLNAYGIYNKHELYVGFDITSLRWKLNRTFGFEGGYKFHFYNEKRKSNFLLDLNYQYSKFSDGCTAPVAYNYMPVDLYDCYALKRIKSQLLSLGIGYELFYKNWISTSLSVGPGINWGVYTIPEYALNNYVGNVDSYTHSFKSIWIVLVKASVRITLKI